MKLTRKKFYHTIGNGHALVIASFGAVWSGNSSMLKRVVTDVTDDFKEVEFIWSDVEANEDLASEWGIRSVPTTLFFRDGEVVDHFTGIISRNKLKKRIIKVL